MSKTFTKTYFKNVTFFTLLLVFALQACDSDDIGEKYYTFTGELMGEYMQARPEQYSEFVKILDTTKVMGLLNAYGKYTCFAPNNEAMHAFYKSTGRTSIEEFPFDSIKKIVYDHIIRGSVLTSEFFVEGRLNEQSMSERFVSTTFQSFASGDLTIKVNKTSPILESDIEVHNGVIHAIGEVLKPTDKTLVEALSADKKFGLFNDALIATGLYEKMLLVEDKSYDPNALTTENEFTGVGSKIRIPKSRKYGFTVLVESDLTFEHHGITNISELSAYASNVYDLVYPEDAGISDVTNPRNSLNRFVAYHLLDKQLSYSRFIIDYDNTGHSIKTYDMYEYIATMCPNTLLEVSTKRVLNETNLFNFISETGEAVRIVSTNYDNDAINGVYHEIDNLLVYDVQVASEMSSKRLRLDGASFFPEFANNGIRGKVFASYPSERWIFPQGYIKGLWTSETTEFGYYSSDDRFLDYQGDEIFLSGLYEFELTTPPIPAGTYEVRLGYKVESKRGAAQLFWDGLPTGIPLDLSIPANDPRIGYVRPGENPSDPFGYENDKMMRNRGYMKGPASFSVGNTIWFSGTARNNSSYLRRILGIYTFHEAGTHQFAVKAARSGEFMLDFLEFVPVEAIETEGID